MNDIKRHKEKQRAEIVINDIYSLLAIIHATIEKLSKFNKYDGVPTIVLKLKELKTKADNSLNLYKLRLKDLK